MVLHSLGSSSSSLTFNKNKKAMPIDRDFDGFVVLKKGSSF